MAKNIRQRIDKGKPHTASHGQTIRNRMDPAMTLARAHRWTAAALAPFLALHLANHLTLAAGPGAHRAAMDLLRPLYRAAVVEPALIALFTLQIGLGLMLARRRGMGRGWAAAQVASGLYLAFFLIQHIPAVLAARAATPPTDTDLHFAAAVLAGWPAHYFAPYYSLAVAAFATHLAAALHFRGCTLPLMPWAGLALGAGVVGGLIATLP
jgi:succinate dehydrogenase/fumarate reductase cytochrome b subunit